MTALPPEDHRRLVSILGRLGSDAEAERATAAKMASGILERHGLQWGDIVRPVAALAPVPLPVDHRQRARKLLLLCRGKWRQWERDFLSSLYQMPNRPSLGQVRKLDELTDKARAWGLVA